VSRYYHRVRRVLDARFHALLARWLKKRPADGWEGTPRDLAAALDQESTGGEYVGRNVVAKVGASPALAPAGFVLTAGRTGKARRVTIRRGG
jgi:hypothetical protein